MMRDAEHGQPRVPVTNRIDLHARLLALDTVGRGRGGEFFRRRYALGESVESPTLVRVELSQRHRPEVRLFGKTTYAEQFYDIVAVELSAQRRERPQTHPGCRAPRFVTGQATFGPDTGEGGAEEQCEHG